MTKNPLRDYQVNLLNGRLSSVVFSVLPLADELKRGGDEARQDKEHLDDLQRTEAWRPC